MICEVFEELAVWLDKKGQTEITQKLRVRVGDLRFNAEMKDKAIVELVISDEIMH